MNSSATTIAETVPERPPEWLAPLTTAEINGLSDRDLALHAWAGWADFQARKRGYTANDLSPEQAEVLRVETLGLDVDDVRQMECQRVLQVIAGGELDRGGRMIRDLVNQWSHHLADMHEAMTRSRYSRSIARRARPNALQELIRDIVQRRPSITLPEMLDEFRHREHQGVVESVADDDETVEWIDTTGRIKTTSWRGIGLRMDRERKNSRKPKSR